MPKSATTAWPPDSMMFSGLMSRWTTPRSWAYCRALPTSRVIWSAVVERELPLPSEPLPERLALGERHHVVEQAAGLSRVVEREDVGMLQRRGDLDLAEEPLAAEHRRQLGLEQLDRDPPAVLQVLGEEHDRHPAVAELPLHAVPIAERRPELLEEVHGCPFTGERCLSNRWRQATSRCRGRQRMCFSTSRAGGPSSPRAFTNPTLGQ